MLAYATGRQRIAARQSSPNTMLFILCGHVAVVAAVMSAKMDLPRAVFDPPTTTISIPIPKPPPPNPRAEPVQPAADPFTDFRQPAQTFTGPTPKVPVEFGNDQGARPLGGGDALRLPDLPPTTPAAVSSEARLLTPAEDLRPPYPRSKILAEEEAALTLRLTIDEHGRVVGVDPIGRVDPVFLDAARKHLLAHWRYQPATKDGRPVSSSIIVSLHFQLDG